MGARARLVSRYSVRLFAVPVLVLLLASLLLELSPSQASDVSNLTMLAAAALASVSAFSASRRCGDRLRPGWRLLSLSALVWALGQAVWSYYEVYAGRSVPFPSGADYGYLASTFLAVAALVAFYRSSPRSAGSVLDGATVAASLVFAWWVLVIEPSLALDPGVSVFNEVVAFSYPFLDLFAVAAAFVTASRLGRRSWPTLGVVAAGLVSIAFADSAFAYMALKGTYATGTLLDLGWVAGFLLIAAAGTAPRALLSSADDSRDPAALSSLLLPLLPLVLGASAAAWSVARGHHIGLVDLALIGLVVSLSALRQTRTSRDNLHLSLRLASSERRFRSLVQESSDMTVVVSPAGELLYAAPAMEDFLAGRSLADTIFPEDRVPTGELFLWMLTSPGLHQILSFRALSPSGEVRFFEAAATNLSEDRSVGGVVLNCRDVSDRRVLEDELRRRAFHDGLTALPNRDLLLRRVGELAESAGSLAAARAAVLFCDLDGFKAVNDSLGHAVGDLLLVEVAARLRGCVHDSDLVARFGGDEFGILLVGDEGDVLLGSAGVVSARILEALSAPFLLEDREVFVGTSIGIALAEDAATSEDLMRNADLAMYQAKSEGRGRAAVFEPSMFEAAAARLVLEDELRHALNRGELSLRYQPVVDLVTGRAVGAEALVRWEHPSRGVVSPDDFIPLAEESGLVVEMGEWILREAVRQVSAWHEEGLVVNCAVNLSPRQLSDTGIVDLVEEVLASSGLAPDRLVLEITETSLLRRDVASERLSQLRRLGVPVALDDFGTGYSSLANLRDFSVDVVKVDRSFVAGAGFDCELSRLTGAVVALGTALGMDVVAEGIESEEQLAAVRSMGAHFGQGFLFAEPLTAEGFAAWARSRRPW